MSKKLKTRSMKPNFDDLVSTIIDNVEKDRESASEALKQVMSVTTMDNLAHENFGASLGKYIEAMIKSNEQLIKLAMAIKKQEEQQGKEEYVETSIEELMLENNDI